MDSLSQTLAEFLVKIKYEDLPAAVVHEAKRTLLDSIGCALAGITTDKGKISIALAKRLGGRPESSIIGVGDKVSCCWAAFANGELINAQDYDSIVTPPLHVSPYVIPGLLALVESTGASGKDLILATILGHEVSIRLSLALDRMFEIIEEGPEKRSIRWSAVSSFNQCIFGGVAAAAKILHLDHKKISYAFGIAGHNCPVPGMRKWMETAPSAMTKYGSPGWVSLASVTATLLADMGYVGDDTVFDGEHGFWRFFGSEKWNPSAVIEKIGETWYFLGTQYKPYPCCRSIHSQLDAFKDIIEKNNLLPEEIEKVEVYGHVLEDKPNWQNQELCTHVDAQFSVPYVFAALAHGVRVDDWQDLATIRNPRILEFMKKVTHQVHPRYFEEKAKDAKSNVGMVKVVSKGKTFKEERIYPKGTPIPGVMCTDDELVEKFKNNASRMLTGVKIEKAVKSLVGLEKVENTADLMIQLTL